MENGTNADNETREGVLGFAWAAFFIALCALVIAGGAIGVAVVNSDSSDSAGASSGSAQTIDVVLADVTMTPKEVTVDSSRPIEFNIVNEGEADHDFWLETGEHTDMLKSGESATLSVDALTEATVAYCTVAGHRAAGMEMKVNVEGAPAGEQTASGGNGSASATEIDFAATAPDGFEARDPAAPLAPGQTEHKITLDVIEKEMEVAPGLTQKMWTFGGTVPGPVFRGKVGDVFTFTLRNRGEVDHSIDFHASKVSWTDEMRSIKSGEQLVYQYTAKHSGIFMYHCGTAPALHHIGNGMYGAIIIDPPGLAPVNKEYVLVQSELYAGPQGKEGDLTKMLNDEWDAVMFNGYVNQYRDHPIQVEPNERIRVWVLDVGPSENSSFHIVGTIFDTVFKEGAFTLQPGPANGGAQALDLQPAQGGFVEFTFDEAGFYPIVTHKFSNASQGGLGLFRAGDATMPGAAGH
jgi:nitrite reductase (NO-forming)